MLAWIQPDAGPGGTRTTNAEGKTRSVGSNNGSVEWR